MDVKDDVTHAERPSSRTARLRGIDRSSYEPAYVQLVGILRDAIAAGEYQPGDQLPTEAELRAAFDLSPMTVRRAIAVLLDQGVVTTTRGRGTFVLPPRLSSASFDLAELQHLLADERVTARVLEARVVPAAARAAAHLGVPQGERVISIRRLLERDGEPLVYQRESLVYDPHRPIVEAELGVTALRDLFEGGASASFKHGELIVHASVLSEEEARHLAAPAGTAAWVFEHLFYGFRDEPLSWGRFVCRGEILRLRTTIGVSGRSPAEPGRVSKKAVPRTAGEEV